MKVLLVSIAAPPKNSPESLQVGKVINGLLDESQEIRLVTEKLNNDYTWETKVKNKLGSNLNNRIDISTKSVWVERLERRFRLTFYPDIQFLFHKKILKAVKTNNADFDVIYSRSSPISSTIAGFKLATKYNRPWVLHLSDPWTINPYYEISKKDKKWELQCFKRANIITLTNKRVIERYSEIYPEFKQKFRLFPNMYLESDVQQNSGEQEQKNQGEDFKIIHTGNLYSFRKPNSFLKGFDYFMDSLGLEERKRIKVIFIGNLQEDSKQSILTSRYHHNIKLLQAVPFEKMKVLQKEADILLSIDARFDLPEKSLFFPSKLLDYMNARRPILALTHLGSPSHEFVNKGYGRAFDHSDYTGVSSFLSDLFWKKESEGREFELAPLDESYSVKKNIKGLINIFENITNDG